MEIEFIGETRYLNDLLFDILEAQSAGEGTTKEINGGAQLVLQPMIVRKGYDVPGALSFILHFGRDIATGLVAAYLYDKIQNHKAKGIRTIVNRREIHVSKSGIIKIIEESVEREEKNKLT